MPRIELGIKSLGLVTVATAGTRVPLSGSQLFVRQVVVQTLGTNAGDIYFGDVTVDAANCLVLNSSQSSVILTADDDVSDEDNMYFDLSKIYIDAQVNGDKVRVMYTEVLDKSYTN